MAPSSRSVQPAKALLAARDIPLARVAQALGYSTAWVGRCLNGRIRPSDKFKSDLADYLDADAEDLFADGPGDVVVHLVRRTSIKSGVPERIEDDATAEKVAHVLRGAS